MLGMKRPGVKRRLKKRPQRVKAKQPERVIERTRTVVVDRHTRHVQTRDTGVGLGTVLAAGLVGHMIGSSNRKTAEPQHVHHEQHEDNTPQPAYEAQVEETRAPEPAYEPEPSPSYDSGSSESFSSGGDGGGVE